MFFFSFQGHSKNSTKGQHLIYSWDKGKDVLWRGWGGEGAAGQDFWGQKLIHNYFTNFPNLVTGR